MGISFEPFELENWQSDYEQSVTFNLSDSTCNPLTLRELLSDEVDLDRLLATKLYYPQVNGESDLREAIARRYPDSVISPEQVLVTVGASEANAAAVDAFCPPGSRVVVMQPGYQQVWGLARNRGCDVVGFSLDPAQGWRPDLAELDEVVDANTSLIYVCNPNNPVGYVLTDEEMDEIVRVAERHGCWLLADEVYAGSEHDPAAPARTFVGRYDRVIGINSMSKSLGLSGLRIGWAVGPPHMIRALWRRHEYAAIASGRIDNVLAAAALHPPTAGRILGRNRQVMLAGWTLFDRWQQEMGGLVRAHQPMATPLAYMAVETDLDSVAVGHRIRELSSTLICPGAFFGHEGFLRMNFGLGETEVAGAIAAMTPVVRAMAEESPRM